jgi:hypothetical protein
MGLNEGVRHKNTTLPKTIYCTENKHRQNPIWVKCRSATQKSILTGDIISTLRGFGVALVLKWGSLGSPGTKWVIHLPTHDVHSNF